MIDEKISGVELSSVDPSITIKSRSGKRFTRSLNRQFWRVSVTWSKMKNDRVQMLYAQLLNMRGSHGTETLTLPLISKHENVSGDIRVIGDALAGANNVSLTGYVGELSKGAVFNFSSHSKLYVVFSQNDHVLTFIPPLRKSISEDFINYMNPSVVLFKSNDETTWNQKRVNGQLTDEFEEDLE